MEFTGITVRGLSEIFGQPPGRFPTQLLLFILSPLRSVMMNFQGLAMQIKLHSPNYNARVCFLFDRCCCTIDLGLSFNHCWLNHKLFELLPADNFLFV